MERERRRDEADPRRAGQKLETKVLTMMPAVASRKNTGAPGTQGQRKGWRVWLATAQHEDRGDGEAVEDPRGEDERSEQLLESSHQGEQGGEEALATVATTGAWARMKAGEGAEEESVGRHGEGSPAPRRA